MSEKYVKIFWIGFSWGVISWLVVLSVFATSWSSEIKMGMGFFLFLVIAGLWLQSKSQNGKSPESNQKGPGGESSKANGRSLPPGHQIHTVLGHIVCMDKKCNCNALKGNLKSGVWEFNAPAGHYFSPGEFVINLVKRCECGGVKNVTGQNLCPHCGGDIAIRMPVPDSGCDHLYYPNRCEICKSNAQKYSLPIV